MLRAATFLDKGGTGKTTSVAHLAVALDREGHDVLAIDLAGKQGDLSKQFGAWDAYQQRIDADPDADVEDAWPNISTVFQDEWDAIASKLGESESVDELVVATDEGPDLIPAHPGLDTLDADLGNIDDAADRFSRLDAFLTEHVAPLERWDVVLIDLPGATNNVTYNGLYAAMNVIAPVEMGPFEADQAGALRNDLERFAKNYDVEVELALVLPNKVDTRTNLADEYLEAFREEYPDAIGPVVPYSQDVRKAADEGRTAFALGEPSATAKRARNRYVEAAQQLVDGGRSA